MAKTKCPLIQAKCWEHGCNWYIQVQGNHPQTGQETSQYDCAVAWLPMLLIENALVGRQTSAAVQSFRNAVMATAPAQDAPLLE
jgi:hypothetical protein